jgi:glycine oxidase
MEGAITQGIRIEPVRGQMLCFEARPPIARHVIYSPRGYLVPRMDGRVLAGSTTEHAGFDKRVTAGGAHTVMTNALEIAPAIADLPLVDAWAGLRPRAADDLPVLGECTQTRGLFYALGHYRNGILLAPITGELLAEEIITGTLSPLVKAFTPERFHQVGVS